MGVSLLFMWITYQNRMKAMNKLVSCLRSTRAREFGCDGWGGLFISISLLTNSNLHDIRRGICNMDSFFLYKTDENSYFSCECLMKNDIRRKISKQMGCYAKENKQIGWKWIIK